MEQYLELVKKIKEEGVYKPAARENMPGTYSIFGEQLRFKLSEGFPLMTTKKINFKHIVTELLWFLKGDTNIKYLVDNDCNIWNEDAYNYYLKIVKKYPISPEIQHHLGTWEKYQPYTFKEFVEVLKSETLEEAKKVSAHQDYTLGDCGKQYGWLWRNWETGINDGLGNYYPMGKNNCGYIDQISELIKGLKKNPMSRRHIITAWNPATLDDMALNACHAFVQFNCRPINNWDQLTWLEKNGNFRSKETKKENDVTIVSEWSGTTYFAQQSDIDKIPKYYLDCQMYQRSADIFLGVPYNIASYALLTEMLAKICNMIPGDFIHTFGDVHLYETHVDQANEQIYRSPKKLPKLEFKNRQSNYEMHEQLDLNEYLKWLSTSNFVLHDYNPDPPIKAKLSTGLF